MTPLRLPPGALAFTADLNGLKPPSGQPQALAGQAGALQALAFGAAVADGGHHVFVIGEPAMDCLAVVRQHLEAVAKTLPTPPSYAYVADASNTRPPVALSLPAGQGRAFAQAIGQLLDEALAALADGVEQAPPPRPGRPDLSAADGALAPLFSALALRYQAAPAAMAYVAALRGHVLDWAADHAPGRRGLARNKAALARRCVPNVMVDHPPGQGAPVVYEANPSHQSLFGHMGAARRRDWPPTGHWRIRAGALHKANGGFLIVDADKLLACPSTWEALKRALQSGRIDIGPPSAPGGHACGLAAEPVPLGVKVVLLGAEHRYEALAEHDAEFGQLFRVVADFGDHWPRNRQSCAELAGLLTAKARALGVAPLANSALERLLEHSCRLAEHQRRFSARINDLLAVVAEVGWLCGQQGAAQVEGSHVRQALAARALRHGRRAQELLDDMLDGAVLIATDGLAIGQVNGLTVMTAAGMDFGAPSRITATVSPGSRGIIDIEREVELGQSIHSKGVLILTGYLSHFYAQQFPLALSASIAMEQSYSEVDGDSASLAELCALLSALARLPIRQELAVTGSINQYGEVQAVGGVNEKIEGFFRLCQARGLTGGQGVVIPAANRHNLMLQPQVIDAVAAGVFSVYCVERVNQALELLTGQPPGEPDQNGAYPEHSINAKAVARLKEMSELSDGKDEAH